MVVVGSQHEDVDEIIGGSQWNGDSCSIRVRIPVARGHTQASIDILDDESQILHKEIVRLVPREGPSKGLGLLPLAILLVSVPPVLIKRIECLDGPESIDPGAKIGDPALDANDELSQVVVMDREEEFNEDPAAEGASNANEVLMQVIRPQPRVRATKLPQRIVVGVEAVLSKELLVGLETDLIFAPTLGRRLWGVIRLHALENFVHVVLVEA